MGLAELFDIYPAVFDGTYINQLDSVDPAPGVEDLIAQAGGTVYPSANAMAFADPRVKLSSRDVQSVLAGVGLLSGKAVSTLAKIQYQKRANGGIYNGNNVHVSLSSTVGFLYIEEFGAQQGAKEGADISLSYVALYDGTNAPLVVNINQALGGSPAVNAVHQLGPVVLEGAQLLGVQKWRFKTGIEFTVKGADGEQSARIGSITKQMAQIEIEGHNLTILNSTGFFKQKMTSGLTCYLQKVDPAQGAIAYGTGGHISLSATQGNYSVTGISGSKGDSAVSKITVNILNNAVSLNTNTTIVIP